MAQSKRTLLALLVTLVHMVSAREVRLVEGRGTQRSLLAVEKIGSIDLYLNRSHPLTRPCRGVDEVRVLLELRIAQMGGMSMADVATTSISCNVAGIKATLEFIDLAGRVYGVNVALLGVDALQSVLDPLTEQYDLALVKMVSYRMNPLYPPIESEAGKPFFGPPAAKR